MFQQVMKIIILVFADVVCVLLEMQRGHFEKIYLPEMIWRAHTRANTYTYERESPFLITALS